MIYLAHFFSNGRIKNEEHPEIRKVDIGCYNERKFNSTVVCENEEDGLWSNDIRRIGSEGGHLSKIEGLGVLTVSIFLGWLVERFFERPFRKVLKSKTGEMFY